MMLNREMQTILRTLLSFIILKSFRNQVIADIVYQSFFVRIVVNIKPFDIFISAKPGELTLGVSSGASFKGFNCIFKAYVAIEIRKKLIVANCLNGGITEFTFVKFFCFFRKSSAI